MRPAQSNSPAATRCRRSRSGLRPRESALRRSAPAPADKAVLGLEHARRKRVRVSSASTGTAACAMIGPAVHFRASRNAPCSHGSACRRASARPCVSRPLKAGSRDGWMLIMPALPALRRTGREDAHEAAEADELDRGARRGRLQRRIERRRGPCRTACDRSPRSRSPAARARAEAGGVRPVGNHERDLGRIGRVACAAAISAAMLEPRPEIRIATRLRVIALIGRSSPDR